MIKLKDIVMIHDLKRQGLSIAAIARETGFDRKTVRRHLARGLEGPSYGPREPRPCKIDKYEDWLLRRTAEVPGLSARRLRREIRDLGFDGSYTTVTNFLREARPPTPTVFERRFETPPGRQAQVDFAEGRFGEFSSGLGAVRTFLPNRVYLAHGLRFRRPQPVSDSRSLEGDRIPRRLPGNLTK